jgi:hypothetical protein
VTGKANSMNSTKMNSKPVMKLPNGGNKLIVSVQERIILKFFLNVILRKRAGFM